MSEDPPRPRRIYHVAEADAWPRAEDVGLYPGGPACRADGFIHFSTWEQLPGTLARFFAGRDDLVLIEADAEQLGAALRWERMGEGVFPHFYGRLRVEHGRDLGPIALGPDGRHLLPRRGEEP